MVLFVETIVPFVEPVTVQLNHPYCQVSVSRYSLLTYLQINHLEKFPVFQCFHESSGTINADYTYLNVSPVKIMEMK